MKSVKFLQQKSRNFTCYVYVHLQLSTKLLYSPTCMLLLNISKVGEGNHKLSFCNVLRFIAQLARLSQNNLSLQKRNTGSIQQSLNPLSVATLIKVPTFTNHRISWKFVKVINIYKSFHQNLDESILMIFLGSFGHFHKKLMQLRTQILCKVKPSNCTLAPLITSEVDNCPNCYGPPSHYRTDSAITFKWYNVLQKTCVSCCHNRNPGLSCGTCFTCLVLLRLRQIMQQRLFSLVTCEVYNEIYADLFWVKLLTNVYLGL